MTAVGLLAAGAPAALHAASHGVHARQAEAAARPISQIRATANTATAEAFKPGGNGYWAVYPDGTVETAPPAGTYGDLSREHLAQPIEGAVATPDGDGYWMVASDGGVFGFGDAHFYGSTGNVRLNQPVVGMAPTPDGHGYWLVAADGGIFSYGDAHFYGSTGNVRLNQPVVGMAPTPDGHGYWLVAADGGIFSYGDAQFHGSGASTLGSQGQRAVGVAGAGQGGYWIETSSGTPLAMGAPLSAQSPPQPAGSTAVESTHLAANQDPSRSITPSAAFQQSCFGSSSSPAACDQASLADINSARAGEGYGPLALPGNYGSLSAQAQLIATANAERASRGLPAMPENGQLDAMAQDGARQNTDPTGPASYGWSSNWAGNYPTALSADYVWMYDDGANSPNIDCTPGDSSGCWGHRHNILSPWGGQAGAGVYDFNGSLSLTQLFVENYR